MAHRNARLTPLTRLELVREVSSGWPQAEVARQFRVSRHTVAKWVRRYREAGAAALADRSSAPHSHPRRTPPQLEHDICAVRAAGFQLGIAHVRANLGRITAHSGRLAEARELFDAALNSLRELGAGALTVFEESVRAVELPLLAEESQRAIDQASELTEEFATASAPGGRGPSPCQQPTWELHLERIRGYALLQLGRPGDATESLRSSLALAEEAGSPRDEGLAIEALPRVARWTGDPGAKRLERDAGAIFERLGIVSTPQIPLPAPRGAARRNGG